MSESPGGDECRSSPERGGHSIPVPGPQYDSEHMFDTDRCLWIDGWRTLSLRAMRTSSQVSQFLRPLRPSRFLR